ncbi:hypothetical protein DIPPA_22916 [Diplonema papillatum]|nr:hypothetical protein DIPPA_22916 [Diplonema papillatum]|eukprot:gene13208-20402_t
MAVRLNPSSYLSIPRFSLIEALVKTLPKNEVDDWESFAQAMSYIVNSSYAAVLEDMRRYSWEESVGIVKERTADQQQDGRDEYITRLLSLISAAQYSPMGQTHWEFGVEAQNYTSGQHVEHDLSDHDQFFLDYFKDHIYWFGTGMENVDRLAPPAFSSDVMLYYRGTMVIKQEGFHLQGKLRYLVSFWLNALSALGRALRLPGFAKKKKTAADGMPHALDIGFEDEPTATTTKSRFSAKKLERVTVDSLCRKHGIWRSFFRTLTLVEPAYSSVVVVYPSPDRMREPKKEPEPEPEPEPEAPPRPAIPELLKEHLSPLTPDGGIAVRSGLKVATDARAEAERPPPSTLRERVQRAREAAAAVVQQAFQLLNVAGPAVQVQSPVHSPGFPPVREGSFAGMPRVGSFSGPQRAASFAMSRAGSLAGPGSFSRAGSLAGFSRGLHHGHGSWAGSGVDLGMTRRVSIAKRPNAAEDRENQELSSFLCVESYRRVPFRDLGLLVPGRKVRLGVGHRTWFAIEAAFCAVCVACSLVCLEAPNSLQSVLMYLLFLGCAFKALYTVQAVSETEQQLSQQLHDWLDQHLVGKGNTYVSSLVNQVQEQELKEIILGYFFLWKKSPLTQRQLDYEVETFLNDQFQIELDFEVEDALQKLILLKLVEETGGKFRCVQRPKDYLDDPTPRWLDFFHSLKSAVGTHAKAKDSAQSKSKNLPLPPGQNHDITFRSDAVMSLKSQGTSSTSSHARDPLKLSKRASQATLATSGSSTVKDGSKRSSLNMSLNSLTMPLSRRKLSKQMPSSFATP